MASFDWAKVTRFWNPTRPSVNPKASQANHQIQFQLCDNRLSISSRLYDNQLRKGICYHHSDNFHTNTNLSPRPLIPFIHQFVNMSTEAKTKKFGSGERSIPHHSEKAPKYYPAEDVAKPKTVRSHLFLRTVEES